MSTPQRIQLRRTKGWRMPGNTVRVCRPGPWGNPFKVFKGSVNGAEIWSVTTSAGPVPVGSKRDAQELAVKYFVMIADCQPDFVEECRKLTGKNLACWCAIGDPCHADIILAIANAEEVPHD